MQALLLGAAMPNKMTIIIAASVGGGLLLISLIYGVIRKFSRLTWIGWQQLLVFGLTMLLTLIKFPAGQNVLAYSVTLGGMLAISAVVLAIGGGVRMRMFEGPRASKGWRVADRLLGMVTAPLTLAMLLLTLGAFGLAAAETVSGRTFVDIPIWTEFGAKHAVDLLLCGLMLLILRGGFRLGILKFLYYALMLSLTVLALVGSVLLVLKVPFFAGLAVKFGALFGKISIGGVPLDPDVVSVLGVAAMSLCLMIAFSIVLILISVLINAGIKAVSRVKVLWFIDGALVCLIFAALFVAVNMALNYGVGFLASGALGGYLANITLPEQLESVQQKIGEIVPMIEQYAARVCTLFCSSPLSGMLFTANPLLTFVPYPAAALPWLE